MAGTRNKYIGISTNNENMGQFFWPTFWLRPWNNGILEYWSAWGGLKGKYPFFILPSTQHCMFPEPNTPVFQYSIIPIARP
jgi:hypothetical protein